MIFVSKLRVPPCTSVVDLLLFLILKFAVSDELAQEAVSGDILG